MNAYAPEDCDQCEAAEGTCWECANDALAEAVAKGHLRGAGVDVFPFEPTTESPLFGLPNVVLTPHTGGSSAEALANVGEMISTTTLAALADHVTDRSA